MAIDKKKFLADQKWKADLLINANKDTNLAGRREDANSWLRNWRSERGIPIDSGVMPPVDHVPLPYRGWLFPRADASTKNNLTIAHGRHEPDAVIHDIPRWFEGGHNPEDHNPPVDPSGNPIEWMRPSDEDIPLAWVRASGSGPMTNNEFIEGLKIINSSSPDPATRDWRELQLIRQATEGV